MRRKGGGSEHGRVAGVGGEKEGWQGWTRKGGVDGGKEGWQGWMGETEGWQELAVRRKGDRAARRKAMVKGRKSGQ